jgi:hypothetical protein
MDAAIGFERRASGGAFEEVKLSGTEKRWLRGKYERCLGVRDETVHPEPDCSLTVILSEGERALDDEAPSH